MDESVGGDVSFDSGDGWTIDSLTHSLAPVPPTPDHTKHIHTDALIQRLREHTPAATTTPILPTPTAAAPAAAATAAAEEEAPATAAATATATTKIPLPPPPPTQARAPLRDIGNSDGGRGLLGGKRGGVGGVVKKQPPPVARERGEKEGGPVVAGGGGEFGVGWCVGV